MLLIVGGTILMSDQTKPITTTSADTASFLVGIGAVLAEVGPGSPLAVTHWALSVPAAAQPRVRTASQVTLSGAVSIYFEKVRS